LSKVGGIPHPEAKHLEQSVQKISYAPYAHLLGKHVDVIFHLAGKSRIMPSFKIPLPYVETNVYGTAAMLDLARHYNAKLVYAGSSTADFDVSENIYALTKFQGEQLLQSYVKLFGLKASICRFYNVYGPRSDTGSDYDSVVAVFARQHAAGKPLTVTGTGGQRRDFTHVKDIARGLIAASERGQAGQVYNLGTGVDFSINALAGLFGGDLEAIPARAGDRKNSLADLLITRRDLGWEPRESLTDYVQSLLEWNKLRTS